MYIQFSGLKYTNITVVLLICFYPPRAKKITVTNKTLDGISRINVCVQLNSVRFILNSQTNTIFSLLIRCQKREVLPKD